MPASELLDIVLSDVFTLITSLMGSAFIAGFRIGRIEASLKDANMRLARIEGMFEMRLKQ